MNSLTSARITSLVLVIGLFFGCASNQPSFSELKESGFFEEALLEINTALQESPGDAGLHLEKAKLLGEWALSKAPELREQDYQEMVNSIGNALEASSAPNIRMASDSLKSRYWSQEHDDAIALSSPKSESKNLEQALIHFQNALTIDSGKASTYRSKAVTEYELGNTSDALNTLRTAIAIIENPPSHLYEDIGLLYLESGNIDDAIANYEQAGIDIIENKNIAFKIVNHYLNNGQQEKAMELLEVLVNEYPDNADLRNVYGTELYHISSEVITKLKEAYQQNDSVLVSQLRVEVEGNAELAEENLSLAYSSDSSNVNYAESIAVFYNNLSAEYLELSTLAFEEHQPYFINKAETIGELAIRYYQQLLSLKPSDQSIQKKLLTLQQLFAEQ